ncbi:hypothetical protein ACX8XN_08990 [Calditrichota bacterium GD2]
MTSKRRAKDCPQAGKALRTLSWLQPFHEVERQKIPGSFRRAASLLLAVS